MRVRCIELHAQGKSYREIQRETGISKSGAQKIVTMEKGLPNHPLKKRGRPFKLTSYDKKRLVRSSDQHPCATLAELVNETQLPIHPKTAGRYLQKENRFVRLALRKPWLSQRNRLARRWWCRQRRHWRKEWCSKIYTDEMTLQVGAGVGERRKVRRLPGLHEASRPQNLQPTFIGTPLSVSFFGAFTFGSTQSWFRCESVVRRSASVIGTSLASTRNSTFMRCFYHTYYHYIKRLEDSIKGLRQLKTG
jgi:transposase